MKINTNKKQKIIKYWKNFDSNGKKVIDLKRNESLAKDFDDKRIQVIKIIKSLIDDFLAKKIDLQTFKSSLDSENKKNNHWGFSAIKGQMFFNQLVNSQNGNLENIDALLIKTINEPNSIEDAKKKIGMLEDFVRNIYDKTDDKRKAPKPSSIPYFLSYFWQIHDYEKWPIYYTSLIESLTNLDLWEEKDCQKDSYEYFYNLMYEIKELLEQYSKEKLTHWDIEHCFWWNNTKEKIVIPPDDGDGEVITPVQEESIISSELKSYIPPVIADLIVLGKQKGINSTKKGYDFEKKIGIAFKMMDFIVKDLGQGKGREPDLIATLRSENTAFIIDGKAHSGDYSIGIDDRAIKEYINKHLPNLINNGFKRNGFIIVSSSFRDNYEDTINDITLETDVKRFALLTSEALLLLIAYKLKGNISTIDISNTLLKNGIIEAKDIFEEFEDV